MFGDFGGHVGGVAVLMLEYRALDWWYWLVTAVLLTVGLMVNRYGLLIAIGLTVIQLIHFFLREKSVMSFPVQVRIGYLMLLLIAIVPGMTWLFWVPAIGTWAQVIVGYCAMARLVSLMPWYRKQPFSLNLLTRTFLTPPVRGSLVD